jgi:DNA-binding transcriptional regulator LsrR (DeoR family)
VGDVLTHFFREDGSLVPDIPGYEQIAFNPADLRRVRKVICLAGGRNKVPALIAAAKTGYYNMLVTDSVTAEAIYTTIRS